MEATKEAFFKILTTTSRTNYWPLYIYGKSGVGKTYAAACAYMMWPPFEVDHNGHRERIYEPIWEDCQLFVADFSALRADRRADATRRRVSGTRLLVLDEVGVRGFTDPQLTAFKELIDLRDGLPFIVTSNKSPAELMDVLKDQRIVDRFLAGTVLEYTGPSKRAERTKREKV